MLAPHQGSFSVKGLVERKKNKEWIMKKGSHKHQLNSYDYFKK